MALANGGYLRPPRQQQPQQEEAGPAFSKNAAFGTTAPAAPIPTVGQPSALANLYAGNDAAAIAGRLQPQQQPRTGNAARGIGAPGAGRQAEAPGAQAPAPQVAQDEQGLQESARAGPGGFINIGRYRDANAGSGQQMAQALAGHVEQEGHAAQQAITAEQRRITGAAGQDLQGINQGDAYGGDSAMSDATRAQAAQAGSDANALNTDAGRMTQLRQMYGEGSGYYGNTSAGLDSFLSGAEGHSDLSAAQQEFGGLENTFNMANQGAQQAVDERHGRDTQRATEWDTKEKARVQKAQDDAAAKKAQDEADAKYNAEHQKKENFFDYENNNRAETTVRDVGEALDPIAWILKATGNQTLEQKLNAGMDSQMGLNSNKVRWSQTVPGLHESDYQDVYDSMTPAELKRLEDMPAAQQGPWVMQRLKEIRDKKIKAR